MLIVIFIEMKCVSTLILFDGIGRGINRFGWLQRSRFWRGSRFLILTAIAEGDVPLARCLLVNRDLNFG